MILIHLSLLHVLGKNQAARGRAIISLVLQCGDATFRYVSCPGSKVPKYPQMMKIENCEFKEIAWVSVFKRIKESWPYLFHTSNATSS